ncbi:MAG: hypothetical protein ACYDGN_09345 [Acidimicrobiales bacterium]
MVPLGAAAVSTGVVGPAEPVAQASASSGANSHWTSCNDKASRSAPRVIWYRIESASGRNRVPRYFWSNRSYRGDIAKIICYESSYGWHAKNVEYFGWYQMSRGGIGGEGVTWHEYWYGTRAHPAGWYQCAAGERYIRNRYGTPAAAWQHERRYGWY